MECHIEQVLYRDQRTIKTRYFDAYEPYYQQDCLSCQKAYQKSPSSMESQSFHLYSSPDCHRHFSSGFCIKSGASISSLDNCHNQYFSKFKRLLHRTDVECGCEDDSYSRISEKRRKGVTTWVKKLQNVLLLSTYLTLLTLPNTFALPAQKMCNRSSDNGFWVNPCGTDFEPTGEPLKQMNVTFIESTIGSARTALDRAKYLKDVFQTQKFDNMGSDWLDSLDSNYDWLPKLPKLSSEEEFKQHLNSLQWQETLLDLFKRLQTISVPLEQVIIDYKNQPYEPKQDEISHNFTEVKNLLGIVLCELHESIADNNLKIIQNVKRDIMPSELREVCNNKTDRDTRDWIVLRELINILQYTIRVCEFLVKGRNKESSS